MVVELHPMKTAAQTRVAERVKAARKSTGLSQERFAAKLGFYRRSIERWESGQVLPDRRAREALAQESGKSESYFSPDEGEEGTLTGDLAAALRLAKVLLASGVMDAANDEAVA